ncbi:MAG: NosD domain-containing protein [Thermoplasmatota archaeon]
MKKQCILVGIIFILITVGLSGCVDTTENDKIDVYAPPPSRFNSNMIGQSQIELTWIKDGNATHTIIEWNNVESWKRGEGIELYNDRGNRYIHTGLKRNTTYYYQAWSYNETTGLWSETYAFARATIQEGFFVCLSGEKNFTSIQQAIDAAPQNYAIFVCSGIYYERLIINKTIFLLGENPETTIIDAQKVGRGIEIKDGASCIISGFTIQNSGSNAPGIEMRTSNTIISNNIIKNTFTGISFFDANHNYVSNNTFIDNSMYAMYIRSASDHNQIHNNLFEDNNYGIRISGSQFNVVFKNNFVNNSRGILVCCGARSNEAYHNNFLKTSEYAISDTVETFGRNLFYNAKIRQGNYYDDYRIKYPDAQQINGVWDIPYQIAGSANNQDAYPMVFLVNKD